MSQEVSTNPRANKSLNSSKSVQPWSAESDADKLMDDLFSDIDRILDGGSKLPTEPVKPEYVSLQSIVMPQLPTPSAGIATQELVPSYDLPEVEQPEQVEATLVQTTIPTVIPQAKRSGWSLEKWLLAGGIISLLVALGLLLANQQKISLPGFLNFSGSSSSESQLPAEDTQFVSYMLRSLNVIENKNKTNEKTATANSSVTNSQAPVVLPTLPAVGSRASVPNQAPQVLERIYIPVYPPQAPAAQNINPSTRAVAPAAKAQAPVKQSAPAPVKQSMPAPVKQSKQAPIKQSTPATVAKLAPPPVMPALPPAPPPSAVDPAASVSAAPTAQHTLVGLMESDERSAALFDIDGSTQRFYVGEGIGASGWILVSVANQEAVIRRNGEVRSVYVGQKF
jgi:cytoskeletal protein RodZ